MTPTSKWAALLAPFLLVAAGPDAPARAPYVPVAERIIKAETEQGQAFAILSDLTDRVGPRLSGSAGAEAAVRWARQRLEADGAKPWTEPVMVPRWVRGVETAEMTAPVHQTLIVTALGGSVPTPDE